MDTVLTCKKKLAHFRIKELKDVLTQLGLAKQGKKQDLMDRVLAMLSNEVSDMHGLAKRNFIGKQGVAEIIDDTYRKLQGTGATNSSTNGESFSEINNVSHKEEVVDSIHLDKKISCPCGSLLRTEYMIQCADTKCHVWQHVYCVLISEDCSEGIAPLPCQFYCEICRINRADPFWVTVAHPLSPVKLIASNIPADGTNPLQNVERTFQVTRTDIDLLQNAEYDIQAWCILLNDKVPFRMQWPLYADLKVNGVPVRTVNRPGSQLLGANGRDDGPMIALYLVEGINQISLSGCDARSFCLGVRLVKQRAVQQILNLIPKEQDGEPFEDALARVCRCIGGGMAMANEDSDDDLEVIADSVTVNLRCPMSGSRIKIAGRFRPCAHMGCFDLETFVQLNQRSRKWQCPVCLKNYSLEDIIIDPYFNRITNMMQNCGEDVTEIDVKPDGSWRVKNGYQFKNLEQWHHPDGSMCVSIIEGSNSVATRQMRKEGIVGDISIKQVCKPWEMQTLSSRNQPEEYFENYSQKVVTMSSSSYESHRDDGDQSVTQDGIRNFDISANNGHEITMNHNTCASLGDDLDVIVLSDSEEENANLTCFETISRTGAGNNGGHSFYAPPGISNACLKDPALDAGMEFSLGPLNSIGNDFEMSHPAFTSGSRAGSQFQLFYTDRDVSDALIDSEYTSVTSSMPMDGYTLTSKCSMDPGRQVVDSSVSYCDAEINDSLVSYPLASVCAEPHLQSLIPTQPPALSVQFDVGNSPQISNSIFGENLTSLGLGSNSGGGNVGAGIHAKPSTSNGLDLVNQCETNEASLRPGMNDEARSNGTTNGKRSHGPFSFPRQPRSARRPHLS